MRTGRRHRAAIAGGPAGAIDDDIAYVTPWGVDLADTCAPVLLLHGEHDRIAPRTHADWLAIHPPYATLQLERGESHISIVTHAEHALRWVDTQRSR